MKFKFTFLSFVAGAIGLSGCGIVHDHYEYELESPSDTTEIRHYKSICVNHRNGAACEYVATNGTYLSDEIKDKYLKLGCNYGYEKACKLSENSFRSSSCNLKNDLNDCYEKSEKIWKDKLYYNSEEPDFYNHLYEGLRFAKKGCELNNENSCYRLGRIAQLLSIAYSDSDVEKKIKSNGFYDYNQKQLNQLAMDSFKNLCDRNNPKGCLELGFFIKKHLGNTPDNISYDTIVKVRKYYKKACDLQYGAGCVAMGDSYFRVRDEFINYTVAKEYFNKALNCRNKDESSESNARYELDSINLIMNRASN